MKSTLSRVQTVLDLLVECELLRQDAIFLVRLLLFQDRKAIKNQSMTKLTLLEQQRRNIQQAAIKKLDTVLLEDSIKTILFAFSTRIYKIIRTFHTRLLSFAPRIAEISQTNSFLQELRLLSIEMLGSQRTVGAYLQHFTNDLRNRFYKQSNCLTKITDFVKDQNCLRNNKYLELIRNNDVTTILICHEKALKRAQTIFEAALIGKTISTNPLTIYKNAMQIVYDGQCCPIIAPIQQGYCEFVLSRWNRLYRDAKSRNSQNIKQQLQYSQKRNQQRILPQMQQSKRKILSQSTRISFKLTRGSQDKNTPQTNRQLIPREHKSKTFEKSQAIFKEKSDVGRQNLCQINVCSIGLVGKTLIMTSQQKNRPDNNFKVLQAVCEDNLSNKLYNNHYAAQQARKNFYRIHKLASQNRSYTIRPLTQSKQNKQVIKQTIIQMKLQQKSLMSKVLRIRRKKKPLIALRQQFVVHCSDQQQQPQQQ